ncbi:MAG: hypothetical protein AAGL97_11635 [Pseudomonadota bacterium]
MGSKRGKRLPSPPGDTTAPADDRRLQELAEALRTEFDEIRDEPIPRNLQDLVEALRAAEKQSGNRH